MRSLLFLLLVVVASESFRIGPDLNNLVQRKCGKTFFHRKVINGNPTQLGDHPWSASVYVRRTGREVMIGPGTIISPRHILFMNIIRSKNDTLTIMNHPLRSQGTCEGAHLILPTEANSKFDVDFEFLKPINNNRQFTDNVDKVIVINGCQHLGRDNLLILSLKNNLHFNRTRNAACLPTSPKYWDQMDEFKMFGVNETGIQVEGTFAPVNCTAEYPYVCAKAVNNYQGLCRGDFGGSAVAKIGKQSTVLGMYASGNMKCDADPMQIESYRYINVGYFHREICETTGVCRKAPENEVEVTTGSVVQPVTATAVGQPIFVTEEATTMDYAEPDSDVRTTVDYAEPDSDLRTTPDYAEPDSDIRPTPDYAEPDSDVRTTPDYAEPDSDLRTTADYAAPDSSIRRATTPSSSSSSSEERPTPASSSSSSEESATPASSSEELTPVIRPYETIVAETFEKMKINGSCLSDSGHGKEIHIHIHLEK